MTRCRARTLFLAAAITALSLPARAEVLLTPEMQNKLTLENLTRTAPASRKPQTPAPQHTQATQPRPAPQTQSALGAARRMAGNDRSQPRTSAR